MPLPLQVKHRVQSSGPTAVLSVPLQSPLEAVLSRHAVALRSVAYLPHRAQTKTGLLRIIGIVSRLYALQSNGAFHSQPSTEPWASARFANSHSATSRDPQFEHLNLSLLKSPTGQGTSLPTKRVADAS